MSKSLLNWIAAVLFTVAAIGNFIAGPLWLGILFTALVILSVYQATRG